MVPPSQLLPPVHPLDDTTGPAADGAPSWWQQRWPSPGFTPLDADAEVDVCVIGGGVSGTSCAWHLARAGARVKLLEAREIAGGASGRNGGFLLAGLHVRYADLRARVGRDRARALYGMTMEGRDELLATAASLDAADLARRTGSLRLAMDEGELGDLATELALLREDGFPVESLAADALPDNLGAQFLGGLRFEGDGASVPAGWVRALAAAAVREGATLHEHTPVVSVGRPRLPRDPHVITTVAGQVVRAGTVIACTEAYLPGLVPELMGRITPYRSQVLAAAPPPAGRRVLSHVTWSRRGWDYAQQTQDGHLIVGGEQVEQPAMYATWQETTDPEDQQMLEAWIRRVLDVEPAVVARWAGVLAVSFDGLPIIGRLPNHPNFLVCGGWGGAGNVLGFVGGSLVARMLGGDAGAVPPEFSAARLNPVG